MGIATMELIWMLVVGVIVGLIAKATMSVHDTRRGAVLVLVSPAR